MTLAALTALLIVAPRPLPTVQQWHKFIGVDGSFSLHHPSGWTATESGVQLRLVSPDGRESMLLVRFAPSNPSEVADGMREMLWNRGVELSVKDRTEEGASVQMDLEAPRDDKAMSGYAIVRTRAGATYWLSYMTFEALYDVARGRALVRSVIGSIAPGDGSRAPGPLSLDAQGGEVTGSLFFTPLGIRRRGLYGGTILREKTGGSAPMVTIYAIQSIPGGDFRLALYEDGSARSEFLIQDSVSGIVSDVPLRYTGRFTIEPDRSLRTDEMKLVSSSKTLLRVEEHLTRLRARASYDETSDRFEAHVEFYDPDKKAWSEWGKKKPIVLRPISR